MTNPDDHFQNSRLQWQQEQQRQLQVAKEAATKMAKLLKAKGISWIELDYNGEGDEGFITNCHWNGIETISEEDIQPLEELVFQILPPGWEINEGSQGSVRFDLETGEVSVEHNWLATAEEERVSGLQLDLDS